MNPRPEVVCDLRSLFKEGATPSRLIRHIAERHKGEARLHLLTQLYFQEAFGIPIVRGLNPTDDYQHADLRYAFLNEQVIHEMVQKREEWDTAHGLGPGESASWLDTLTASGHPQRLNQIQATAIPELSRCWPQLTPDEQHYIQRSLASANGLYETVKILSRLVECLQQRCTFTSRGWQVYRLPGRRIGVLDRDTSYLPWPRFEAALSLRRISSSWASCTTAE